MINLNLKEKIREFWKKYEKFHLIFLSGFIFGIFFMNWMLFFLGIIDLRTPIFFTIFTVLLGGIALLSKSKYKLTTAKIVYIGFGGIGLGGIIWFITGYIFVAAPWAPLRILPPVLRGRIFLSILFGSWGLGSLIGYFLGKKRNWKTIFTEQVNNE